MSAQQESADQEVVRNESPLLIEGVDQPLTPLQYHYLSLLQRLIATKSSYQTNPEFETWMMEAVKKSVYSALRDCIEANVGDAAKEMLNEEHQVNSNPNTPNTCLLYTSPSPRDRTRSRMPSSA